MVRRCFIIAHFGRSTMAAECNCRLLLSTNHNPLLIAAYVKLGSLSHLSPDLRLTEYAKRSPLACRGNPSEWGTFAPRGSSSTALTMFSIRIAGGWFFAMRRDRK